MGVVDVIVVGALALGVADYVVPKRHKKRLNDLVAELWFKLSAFTYREVALKASSRALMYMAKAFRNEQGLVRVKLIFVIFLTAYSIPFITTISMGAYDIFYLDNEKVEEIIIKIIEPIEKFKIDFPDRKENLEKVINYFNNNGSNFIAHYFTVTVAYTVFYSIFTNIAPSIALGIISMLVTLQLLERARFLESSITLVAISIIDLLLAILFAFISMSIVVFLAHDLNAYLLARNQWNYDPYIKMIFDIELNWHDYLSIKLATNPNPTTSDISSIQSLSSMITHSFHELISGNISIGIFESFLNYNMLLSLFPTIFHLSLIFLLISLKFFDFILRKPMLFTLEWINAHEKGAVAPVAAVVGLGAKLIEKAVS